MRSLNFYGVCIPRLTNTGRGRASHPTSRFLYTFRNQVRVPSVVCFQLDLLTFGPIVIAIHKTNRYLSYLCSFDIFARKLHMPYLFGDRH